MRGRGIPARDVVSSRTRVAAALNFDGFGAGRDALYERVNTPAGAGAPVPLAAPVAAGSAIGHGSDPRCHVVCALTPVDVAPFVRDPPLGPGPPVGEGR